MELRELGTPAQLWRRWVLLAAGHAARGTDSRTDAGRAGGFEIRRGDGCAHLEQGTAWLRMRRLGGNRAVVWGHHDDVLVDPGFVADLTDSAPDWSYDIDSAYARKQVGFLAWHAHGSWSSVPVRTPEPVAALLAPLTDDTAVAGWWTDVWPGADAEALQRVLADPDPAALTALVGAAAAARAGRQVTLGGAWSTRPLSDAATVHLRSQIHAQMRAGDEIADRGHPARPPLLRQWARVNSPSLAYRHAVCALGPSTTPTLVPAPSDRGLTEAQVRSLDNVLMELRMAETDEASGAWMFACVSGAARSITLERAYDSWPGWYDATTGPTMTALHAEMTQRVARWRPSWATLLPVDRF